MADTYTLVLPPEFRSGNEIPVERATITRERMAEIQAEAIEAYQRQQKERVRQLMTDTAPYIAAAAAEGRRAADTPHGPVFFSCAGDDQSYPDEPDGWEPIETAPTDGTEVLCWREDCGQFIASYTSPESFPLTQAEIDQLDEGTLFSKDWFTQWPQAIRLDGSEKPTRWQPLPPPPKE